MQNFYIRQLGFLVQRKQQQNLNSLNFKASCYFFSLLSPFLYRKTYQFPIARFYVKKYKKNVESL